MSTWIRNLHLKSALQRLTGRDVGLVVLEPRLLVSLLLRAAGVLQAFEQHFGAGVSLLRKFTGFGHDGLELVLNFLRFLKRPLLGAFHRAELTSLRDELHRLETEIDQQSAVARMK